MNRRSCSSQRWTGLKTHRSEVPGVARKLSERCFSCVDRLPTYPSQKCFESILKHILADFSGLQARISIKLLHSRHFWKWKPDSDSLPRYASQNRIAAKMALHMIAVCLLYIGFRARDTATICFADAARIRVKSHMCLLITKPVSLLPRFSDDLVEAPHRSQEFNKERSGATSFERRISLRIPWASQAACELPLASLVSSFHQKVVKRRLKFVFTH